MSSESAGHGGSCGVLVTTLEFVPSFWGPLHFYRNLDWYGRVFPVLTHSTGALPTQG